MPDIGKLTVQTRSASTKGAARKVRARGLVPGVCYGRGIEPVAVALKADDLRGALDPQRGANTVIAMELAGSGQTWNVLLRDVQRDALSQQVLHADFMVVRNEEDVRVTVPVVLIGKPEGVTQGGILHQNYRRLPIACRPDRIPIKVEVDVTKLTIGHAVHISELKLGEGIRPLVDPRESIASVVAPKEEKTVSDEAAAAATAAEAAAGAVPGAAPTGAPGAAPGAAPTAGAAKGAAPGAAQPAVAGAKPAGPAAAAGKREEKKK